MVPSSMESARLLSCRPSSWKAETRIRAWINDFQEAFGILKRKHLHSVKASGGDGVWQRFLNKQTDYFLRCFCGVDRGSTALGCLVDSRDPRGFLWECSSSILSPNVRVLPGNVGPLLQGDWFKDQTGHELDKMVDRRLTLLVSSMIQI